MPKMKQTNETTRLTSVGGTQAAKLVTVPYLRDRNVRHLIWVVSVLEALSEQRGVLVVNGEPEESLDRLPEEVVGLASTRVELGLLSPSSAKAATVAIRARNLLKELRPKLERLLNGLGGEGESP